MSVHTVVRVLGGEVSPDELGVGRGQRTGPGPFAPVTDPDQAGRGDHPRDPPAPAPDAQAEAEVGVDPRRPVSPRDRAWTSVIVAVRTASGSSRAEGDLLRWS